jgi:hypothetical protein
MRGAIPPLPNTPSCRGVQLKHGDNFTSSSFHILRLIYKYTLKKEENMDDHGCDGRAGFIVKFYVFQN